MHGDGVVCGVVLEVDEDVDNPYTGIFRTGSDTAILRFSSVLDPVGQFSSSLHQWEALLYSIASYGCASV